mgnify:CR=1 FL=1
MPKIGQFIETVMRSKQNGTYLRQLNHWERIPIIILEKFGLQPLPQIMEDLYARKSNNITSQLPLSKWIEYINETSLTDVKLDKLTAKAHRIELKENLGEKRNNSPE